MLIPAERSTAQLKLLTSRNNLLDKMPDPASSQSMTGSAYSCMLAVKMTRVYHAETCDARCVSTTRATNTTRTHLSQEEVYKWALVNMVRCAAATEGNLDLVVRLTLATHGKAKKASAVRRQRARSAMYKRLVEVEYKRLGQMKRRASRGNGQTSASVGRRSEIRRGSARDARLGLIRRERLHLRAHNGNRRIRGRAHSKERHCRIRYRLFAHSTLHVRQ